jgi:hypothetical protein
MLTPLGRHSLLAKVEFAFLPKSGASYCLCTSPLVFIQNLPIRWSALRCVALIALNNLLSLHPVKPGKMQDLPMLIKSASEL